VRKLGGDNAPELKLPSEEDFNYHLKNIRGAIEKKDTAVNLVRLANQSAEKACKGFGKTIARLIKLDRSDDPMAFQRELELLGYGLKVTGSPIQLSIHDMLLGDVTQQAYKRGFEAGESGKGLSNPYPDPSDLAAEFTRGYGHGQAKNLGLTTEQADAAVAEGANGNGSSSDPWPDDQQASGGEEIPGFLKRDKASTEPARH
jgi:hypothetical protein